MTIGFNLLILVVGLLMWVIAAHAKIQEAGRIMFFCGLLAICLGAGQIVSLLGGPGTH